MAKQQEVIDSLVGLLEGVGISVEITDNWQVVMSPSGKFPELLGGEVEGEPVGEDEPDPKPARGWRK